MFLPEGTKTFIQFHLMVNQEILARKTETGDIVTSSVVLSREASESKLIGPTPTLRLMLSCCFI